MLRDAFHRRDDLLDLHARNIERLLKEAVRMDINGLDAFALHHHGQTLRRRVRVCSHRHAAATEDQTGERAGRVQEIQICRHWRSLPHVIGRTLIRRQAAAATGMTQTSSALSGPVLSRRPCYGLRHRRTPWLSTSRPCCPPDCRPPAVRWPGLAKYNFTGGNNDADEVPVDDLIAAATASLKREGRNLATYNLAHGPHGYRPLREFLVTKLKRDAGIACSADDILMLSGSSQALDLVNAALLSRGDTVICEKDNYQSTLTRFARLGVTAIGIPLDKDGMRMDALARPSPTARRAACSRR